jgi:hypothetical protein
VVTNVAGSSGRISGYARVFDDGSGESWSIVDWSRFQPFRLGDAMRVPFVDGMTSAQPPGGGRRRAASHAANDPGRTDVTLFNPSNAEVRATVQVVDAAGSASQTEVAVAPRQTVTLTNVGANVRTPTAQVIIAPLRAGQLVVTARSSRSSASGSGVPVVSAGNGLRVGQSQIFSNLSDSTSATVALAAPGTYRTSFGLVETSGASAVVRARVFLDEGRSLASSAIYRDFQLSAGQQVVVDELVRAIVGSSRDNVLGDLHNLQLRVEVTSGSGSVVPFVIMTDNATGDSILRLE